MLLWHRQSPVILHLSSCADGLCCLGAEQCNIKRLTWLSWKKCRRWIFHPCFLQSVFKRFLRDSLQLSVAQCSLKNSVELSSSAHHTGLEGAVDYYAPLFIWFTALPQRIQPRKWANLPSPSSLQTPVEWQWLTTRCKKLDWWPYALVWFSHVFWCTPLCLVSVNAIGIIGLIGLSSGLPYTTNLKMPSLQSHM